MRCRLSLLPECVCCSRRSQVPLWNIHLHILSYHNKNVPCTPIEIGRDFVCLGKLWNMGLLFKKPLPAVRGSCWAFFSLSFAFFLWQIINCFPTSWAFSTGATAQNSFSTQLGVTHACVWKPTGSSFELFPLWIVSEQSKHSQQIPPPRDSPPVKDMHGNDKRRRKRLFPPLLPYWSHQFAKSRFPRIVDWIAWSSDSHSRGNTDNY